MEKINIKKFVNSILLENYDAAAEMLEKILLEKQTIREKLATKLLKEDKDDITDDDLNIDDVDFSGTKDEEPVEEEKKMVVCFSTSNQELIDLLSKEFTSISITSTDEDGKTHTADFDFAEMSDFAVVDPNEFEEEEDTEKEEEDTDEEETDDIEDECINTEAVVTEAEGDSAKSNDSEENDDDSTPEEGIKDPAEDQQNDSGNDVDSMPVVDDENPNIPKEGDPVSQSELDQIGSDIEKSATKAAILNLENLKQDLIKMTDDISTIRPSIDDLKSDSSSEESRKYVTASVLIDEVENAKNELSVYIQNRIDSLKTESVNATKSIASNAETLVNEAVSGSNAVTEEEFKKIDEKINYLKNTLDNVKTQYIGTNTNELDKIGNIDSADEGSKDETSVDSDEANTEENGDKEAGEDSSEDEGKSVEGENGESEESKPEEESDKEGEEQSVSDEEK